jgi:hypothetical protein
MKKYLLFALLAVIILTTIILQTTSYADDSDFEVTYDFSPQLVGSLGAEIKLTLEVTNTGSTDINWIDVVVNNTTPFSERSTITINPGTSKTLVYSIPFTDSDLNVDRILQVSMSNDVANKPNGVKMFNFQIQGTDDIFDVSASISPVKSQYQSGDTITVTHTFTNLISTHATTETTSTAFIAVDTNHVYDHPTITHGNVFPGNTISNSFVYTLQEADIGHVKAYYSMKFKLMGKEYNFEASTIEFDVVPRPKIKFNANLSASPNKINPGDTVTFTVNLQITSSTTIDNFEIRNAEGGVMASTESLAAGASRTVQLSANIAESTNVSYVVVGRMGSRNATKQTNTVQITVRKPPTPTPDPTPIPVTPTPTAKPTPTATATLVPTITLINTDEASTPAIIMSQEPVITPQPPSKNNNGKTSFLLVLIIIILILLITGVVGIGIMLFNKHSISIFKKTKKNNDTTNNDNGDNHFNPYE